LIDEALRVGGINTFLMYRPETFLKFSKEFLATEVSSETLTEVRDISLLRVQDRTSRSKVMERSGVAERLVFNWLSTRFERVVRKKSGFPDFVASVKAKRFGFEVKSIRSPASAVRRVHELANRAYHAITEGDLDLVTVVWVAEDEKVAQGILGRLKKVHIGELPKTIRSLVGVIDLTDDGERYFRPIGDFTFGIDDYEGDLFT